MLDGLLLHPRFELPWDFSVHPFAHQHAAFSQERASSHGLLVSEHDTRRFQAFVSLDSHVYPYASRLALSVVGGFNQWLYFLDDQYDDHPGTHSDLARIRQLMERGFALLCGARVEAESTPFGRFTRELRRDFELLAGPGFLDRFLKNTQEYLFEGSLRGLGHWVRRETLGLDDYIELRALDSGVYPVMDCIELAAGINAARAVLECPTLVQMRDCAVRHVALANDVFSYEKEVLWHGSTVNLLHVLQNREGRKLESAVTRAMDLINGYVRTFQRLEQMLPKLSEADQGALNAYVIGMKAWMMGHVGFSMRSQRFRSERSPFSELRLPRQYSDVELTELPSGFTSLPDHEARSA